MFVTMRLDVCFPTIGDREGGWAGCTFSKNVTLPMAPFVGLQIRPVEWPQEFLEIVEVVVHLDVDSEPNESDVVCYILLRDTSQYATIIEILEGYTESGWRQIGQYAHNVPCPVEEEEA